MTNAVPITLTRPLDDPRYYRFHLEAGSGRATACARITVGPVLSEPKLKLNKNDLAKITSITIIVALLLSIQAPVFALTEGPAEVLIQTPSGLQTNTQNLPLPQIPGYNLSFVYRDSSFEKLSGQDASLVYAYGSTNQTKPTVWVSVEIAKTTASLHRWETCLINWPLSQGTQPKITQLDLSDVQTQANPPIVGRYFAFQYRSTNQTQVVLYWFETATFNFNGTAQQKHVKMSLVTYPKSPEGVPEAETLLLPIAAAINAYWQPIKTWTTIALTISQNGLTLSATTTALLIALLIYRLIQNQQEKTSLLRLFSKLPEQTQQLITAVRNTQKQKNSTTQAIAEELQKITKTPTSQTWLTEKLNETENTGLIKKTIVNRNDTPAVVYKNQVPNKTSILKKLRLVMPL
jgi:hypothetical protein